MTQAARAHRAPLSPAPSVAARPRGARHRARRGASPSRSTSPTRARGAPSRSPPRRSPDAPRIRSWAGPSGLPEALYRALRVDLGARAAAPVLTGDVAAIDFPGRAFTVLGVDPFAEAPFRPYLGPADGRSGADGRRAADERVAPGAGQRREPAARDPLGAVAELITRPGAVLVARPTARDLALAVGDRLNVRVAGMPRALTVTGILEPADPASARALDGLLVTDIATAQELFGAAGRLSRIDLIVPDDAAGRALLDRIARALPPGAELVAAGARGGHHRADDPRLSVEPDRALAPGPRRRHVPHLQDHDVLGGAAAAAHRLAPGPRRVARGDLRAGDGRGAR